MTDNKEILNELETIDFSKAVHKKEDKFDGRYFNFHTDVYDFDGFEIRILVEGNYPMHKDPYHTYTLKRVGSVYCNIPISKKLYNRIFKASGPLPFNKERILKLLKDLPHHE